MTIGLMLTFFDFRNDIRRIIEELLHNHRVVIFIRPEHAGLLGNYTNAGFDVRIIEEGDKSFRNRFVSRLFLLFRKLPASRRNYFQIEYYKAAGAADARLKRKALNILRLQKILPGILSYDGFLKMLRPTCKTDLLGIDKMIVCTEIYDDLLFARLLDSTIPVSTYVYSWDHACKHVKFSKRSRYLVWNEGIAEDVQHLQGIPSNNIQITGATQFGYIDAFRSKNPDRPRKNNTIYFGCGIGIPELVPQEIRIITILAMHMQQILPQHTLIVRPYPNHKDWSVLDPLLSLSNVQLDNTYRTKDLSVEDTAIFDKFLKIQQADAFFHVGTTLGLEACFLDCPSFLLDLADKTDQDISMHHFTHQYQNEKYLMEPFNANTIRNEMQLRETLANLRDPGYMALNMHIRKTFPVHSFTALAEALIA